MHVKKVPLRKCTGCQTMKNKNELLRVVRESKEFSVDTTTKKAGRGAYVCKNTVCLEKAQKSKGFERSFKSPVSKNLYECLKAEISVITEGNLNE